MKRKFGRLLALVAVFGLFCTSCPGGDEPAAPAGKLAVPSGTEEPLAGNDEATVGLKCDVYATPDYTSVGSNVRAVRLPASMNASDYGTSASGVMVKTLVDRAEEPSGGKMVVQVFPVNQLAPTTDDIVDGLVAGAFEMSGADQVNWGDYTTAFIPLNVPFLYPNKQTTYAVMSGEIGDGVREQLLADTGLRTVGFMYLGMRALSNDPKEIHSPTDMKSMKLRVQSDPIQATAFKGLGASVMTTSFSELSATLQQGLCDGQDNPTITIVPQKLYEVQNYTTMLNHLPNLSMVVMSDAYYQSLPAEKQGWINQAGQDATEACYQTMLDTTQILIDQLTDYGIGITYFTGEEYQVFEDSVPNTWAMCEEAMGTDVWNELLAAVEAAQSEA